jgi:quercetin dioxygenase-like cupin family protein
MTTNLDRTGPMTMFEPQFPVLMRVSADEASFFSPEPGLLRRILAHNEKMMLVEHRMEATWVGARHSHPHDQMVYVIQGRLLFSCGDEEFEARAGDSFVLKGGIEHSARALEAAVVLDVFTPFRADYLSGNDLAGRRPRDDQNRDS